MGEKLDWMGLAGFFAAILILLNLLRKLINPRQQAVVEKSFMKMIGKQIS